MITFEKIEVSVFRFVFLLALPLLKGLLILIICIDQNKHVCRLLIDCVRIMFMILCSTMG